MGVEGQGANAPAIHVPWQTDADHGSAPEDGQRTGVNADEVSSHEGG
jgi:hypothetical protein